MEHPRAADARRHRIAPVRHLLFILAAVLLASACEGEPPPPSDPELRKALDLDDEVVIHRIDVGLDLSAGEEGAGDEAPVVRPDSLLVRPGDVVQIVALDHRVHLVRFPEDRIAPPLLAFLRETNQDRPPPLVEQGARLVLSFEDAPAGAYPFRVEGNGPVTSGNIRVLEP